MPLRTFPISRSLGRFEYWWATFGRRALSVLASYMQRLDERCELELGFLSRSTFFDQKFSMKPRSSLLENFCGSCGRVGVFSECKLHIASKHLAHIRVYMNTCGIITKCVCTFPSQETHMHSFMRTTYRFSAQILERNIVHILSKHGAPHKGLYPSVTTLPLQYRWAVVPTQSSADAMTGLRYW